MDSSTDWCKRARRMQNATTASEGTNVRRADCTAAPHGSGTAGNRRESAGRGAGGRAIGRYLPILPDVSRRKPGTLLSLETEILEAALSMRRSGRATFHGFGLARAMREQGGSRSLTGHGTLYKALSRLEQFGLLTSRWENAAAAEGRPRRRLYELTRQGADAAGQAVAANAGRATRPLPRAVSEPV